MKRCTSACRTTTRWSSTHGNGAEHAMQGETYFLRGDAANAEIECHMAINAAKRKNQYSILVAAELLRMRIEIYKGEKRDIKETCSALREKLKQKKQFILINTLDMCETWLQSVTGQAGAYAPWILSQRALSAW